MITAVALLSDTHRAAVLDHGHLVTVGAPGEAALAFREHLRKRGAEVPKELDDPTLLRNLDPDIVCAVPA